MRQRLGIIILAAAATVGGCAVNQDEQRALTGPSGLAQTVSITANPDTLVLNGQQSFVAIEAIGATGGPWANLPVHLDIVAGGAVANCGRLSLTDVTTASDGRAGVVFTAPTLPMPQPECTNATGGVTILATPVGTNAQTSNSFSAGIRFLTPSTASQPTAFAVNFTMTPNPGRVAIPVAFNGTSSVSPGHSISSYLWSFGDGVAKSGGSVTHDFGVAGTYTVSLTITDDIGQSGSKSGLLTITN